MKRKNELSFVTFKNGLITFERQFTCRTYKSNFRKGIKIARILTKNGMKEILPCPSNRIVYVKEI